MNTVVFHVVLNPGEEKNIYFRLRIYYELIFYLYDAHIYIFNLTPTSYFKIKFYTVKM